jgi:transcriptional regulator with XRE-family HTH domain
LRGLVNAERQFGRHATAPLGLPDGILAEAAGGFAELGFGFSEADGLFDECADCHATDETLIGVVLSTPFCVKFVVLHNTRRCYIQTMTDNESNIGIMVRTARLDHKLSQPELARRVGTTQQTIEKIELGKIKHSSFMPAIAQELNIAIGKVVRNPRPLAAPLEIPGEKLTGDRDLAVYAAVQGGSGVLILSSDPVEYVVRPDPLARVRDGYGVIVVEDSMVPEFRSGDIALVNPHLPPRAGDTCVFRHQEEDPPLRASLILSR